MGHGLEHGKYIKSIWNPRVGEWRDGWLAPWSKYHVVFQFITVMCIISDLEILIKMKIKKGVCAIVLLVQTSKWPSDVMDSIENGTTFSMERYSEVILSEHPTCSLHRLVSWGSSCQRELRGIRSWRINKSGEIVMGSTIRIQRHMGGALNN